MTGPLNQGTRSKAAAPQQSPEGRVARGWRRARGWIAKHVFGRRKKDAPESPAPRRRVHWIPIGAALLVAGAVTFRLIVGSSTPGIPPAAAKGRQDKPFPRYEEEKKNEALTQIGYSNPDIGLDVGSVNGWTMKLGDREDLPRQPYQGTLLLMTRENPAAGRPADAPVVSVVRRKLQSRDQSALSFLENHIRSSGGRQILEDPAPLSIVGMKAARGVYAQGPVVAVQYAFARPSDVILLTALVERSKYNETFKAEIDAIARNLRFAEAGS